MTTIPEGDVCADLADKAFETNQPAVIGEIATNFLQHVVHNHTIELIELLAEKYVPVFMAKRALR